MRSREARRRSHAELVPEDSFIKLASERRRKGKERKRKEKEKGDEPLKIHENDRKSVKKGAWRIQLNSEKHKEN